MRATSSAACSAAARRSRKFSGLAHDGVAEAEEVLRAHFDHEHVHHQKDEVLELRRDLRHEPAHFRTRQRFGNFRQRIGVLAEQHVAHGEPHRIVTADAGGIVAAFVETMCTQQTLVQMARRGLGNIVDDDRLEIRRLRRRQPLAARFDHAGDRQRIPQRLSETLLQQQRLLRHVREVAFDHQLLRGIDHLVTAAFQSLRPGADRRPAIQRARRDVFARRIEAAVQLVARFEMRFRIRMIGKDLVRRIAELGHASFLPVSRAFLIEALD